MPQPKIDRDKLRAAVRKLRDEQLFCMLDDALERIFGLLRHIDEGHDDVIFFADEGGSWQVGVNWAKVFPRWFACLSATAVPEEYARKILAVVDEFEKFSRDKHLTMAKRMATTEQKKALESCWRPGG